MSEELKRDDPMSYGQIAYERAFPNKDNRVPFKLLPDWMAHQWHRQAEADRAALSTERAAHNTEKTK